MFNIRSVKLIALALCSSAAVSCAKGTGTPAPPMSVAAQDLSVTFHERMAAAAEQDRGQCMKLATDLRAVIEAARPPLLQSDNVLAQVGHDDDKLPDLAPEIGGLDASHRARVEAALNRMRPVLKPCARTPELRAALDQLSH